MHIHVDEIKQALKAPLPGKEAHDLISSYVRITAEEARVQDPPPKESAVLVLIYPKDIHWHTVYIRRPNYDGVHSRQIAFPGGGREAVDRSLVDTALREANEELSIPPSRTEIIGELSEIFIPPSNYVVKPYIGLTQERPEFIPDPREVEGVIENPIHRLFEDDVIKETDMYLSRYDQTIRVKYFDIEQETVWGATAMILSEFRSLLKPLFQNI